MKLYKSSLGFGICANISPYSKEATALLNILEPLITKCSMPDCDEGAVRVGVYEIINRKSDDKYDSEFRGLCERHEVTGSDELTVDVTKLSEVL